MNAPTDARYLLNLDDRYTVESKRIYLNGMQALLRLLIERRHDQRHGLDTAGFVSGYPGSPVGGVDDEMLANQRHLDANRVVFQPGLNEELAATAVFGSQTLHAVPGAKADGVFGLWYGKSPGVDRAADAFRHANFRGVGKNGGVLAVAGDDPHARSTIYPSDSNLLFASLFMPVLAPGNIQEVLDFGLHGYALSRAAGLWVGFKLVTDVADSAASAEVGPGRVEPVLPSVVFDGKPLVPALRVNEAGPPMLEAEREILDGRLEVAREYARLNGLNRIVVDPPAAQLGILTGGKTYYDLRQALADLGLDDAALLARGIRILTLGMLYPLEPTIVQTFAAGLREIIVVEDKRPFLELFLKDLLYAGAERPVVVGKRDERGRALLPAHGELSADVIAEVLAKRLGLPAVSTEGARDAVRHATSIVPIPVLASRTPYFCSGCPHNRALQVPPGSLVGAGIGCHVMALWMGKVYGDVTGYTQMGGEGAQWVGLAPFTDSRHFFQNLGDGTFHHSGSLAIRFAIAANANITYKVLYNKAVAMTGGQDVTGAMGVPAMVAMLQAEGARRVIVTTDQPERYPGGRAGAAEVWHRDRLVDAERELAATPGVTVLINDQQCAAEKRRLRRRGKLAYQPRSVFINERVCEGCGDCGRKSNCLSVQPIETEFGRKTQIHQSSCNQDFSCLDGDCPSFMTIEAAGSAPAQPPKRTALPFPADVRLPEPTPAISGRRYAACLMGIGGTGVVTVNQILGMAAFLTGKQVQTYDHTGSSQKAGPVISHLKILEPGDEAAPTLSKGSADLYLAFDALVGVNAGNLALAAPQRTIAVVSTTQVPTGDMVSNVAAVYPRGSQLRERIERVTRADRNAFVNAQELAEQLLGDHMANNLLMVGFAYQLGALPIEAAAIEAAIRLNGTAVEMNLAAFRWGRLFIADRARVESALAGRDAKPAVAVPSAEAAAILRGVPAAAALASPELAAAAPATPELATPELARVLAIRVPELIAYQDAAYARRYVDAVRRVAEAEQRQAPGREALAVAVARNLYKLMAYKDEYEVARLHLAAEADAKLQRTFGPGARVSWHFQPTFLRSLGVRRKVAVGAWFRPVLQVLRGLKRLRATPLDLLGRARVRRIERALIEHYVELIEATCKRLSSASHELAVELANAPDMVRGYEHVKLDNVSKYLARVELLQRRLGTTVALGPELASVPIAADPPPDQPAELPKAA